MGVATPSWLKRRCITERLLDASARQLHTATIETVSEHTRISAAFIAGYNALQAAQPRYSNPLDDHPLARIVRTGAARVGLSEADLTVGLQLLDWEYKRYWLEPPPVTAEDATAWARRVRDAVLMLKAKLKT